MTAGVFSPAPQHDQLYRGLRLIEYGLVAMYFEKLDCGLFYQILPQPLEVRPVVHGRRDNISELTSRLQRLHSRLKEQSKYIDPS